MNDELLIESGMTEFLSASQARLYRAVPFSYAEGILNLYLDESSADIHTLNEELEVITGKKIAVNKKEPAVIDSLIDKYYPAGKEDSRTKEQFFKGDADAFFRKVISEARALKSSDIHIEAYEELCRVRIRVDGNLLLRYRLEKSFYPSLINKIKIAADLDISEKRLPQDGRIIFEQNNIKFDIRVSISPTLFGEKIVLRLLNKDSTNIELDSLGFTSDELANYLECLKQPHGLVLISGPTGSGKTTTLYATLKLLNKPAKNILTIEDPIEYTLEGVNQVQLKENIGLSFSTALRSFLRQDPDIIMLGEIRDAETANMALRAALTGHLVLSTIHTNSAWGIVSRLIDMGIEPYLLATTLNLAVAQRLVRLLCNNCKTAAAFKPELYPKGFNPPRSIVDHYQAVGCSQCFNTGYKGRKPVFEVIPVDHEIAEFIKSQASQIDELRESKNLRKISTNAFELFEAGKTSLEEVYPLLIN